MAKQRSGGSGDGYSQPARAPRPPGAPGHQGQSGLKETLEKLASVLESLVPLMAGKGPSHAPPQSAPIPPPNPSSAPRPSPASPPPAPRFDPTFRPAPQGPAAPFDWQFSPMRPRAAAAPAPQPVPVPPRPQSQPQPQPSQPQGVNRAGTGWASYAPPQGGRGSGGGRRQIGDMDDREVVERFRKIMGSALKGFSEADVSRVGGPGGGIDWRATGAAARRAHQQEVQEQNLPKAHQQMRRGMTDGFVKELQRILPESISGPITQGLVKTRAWNDMSRSFADVARTARTSGMANVAAAAGIAKYATAAMAGFSAVGGVLGVGVGMAQAGYQTGQRQMQRMSAIAPYSGGLVSEYVGLEMDRYHRRVDRARLNEDTGSALMRSRSMLEDSLMKPTAMLDNVKNQIGSMTFGAMSFGANLVSNALGVTGEAGVFSGKSNVQFLANMGSTKVGAGNMIAQNGAAHLGGGMLGQFGANLLGGLVAGPLSPDEIKFQKDIKWLQEEGHEQYAAGMQIPALLTGMVGFMTGAFGDGPGIGGFQAGVRKATREATQQAQDFEEEKGNHHNAWMQAFGAIAENAAIEDRNARGPEWNLGPMPARAAGGLDGAGFNDRPGRAAKRWLARRAWWQRGGR